MALIILGHLAAGPEGGAAAMPPAMPPAQGRSHACAERGCASTSSYRCMGCVQRFCNAHLFIYAVTTPHGRGGACNYEVCARCRRREAAADAACS